MRSVTDTIDSCTFVVSNHNLEIPLKLQVKCVDLPAEGERHDHNGLPPASPALLNFTEDRMAKISKKQGNSHTFQLLLEQAVHWPSPTTKRRFMQRNLIHEGAFN
jgi:hypothetical protein